MAAVVAGLFSGLIFGVGLVLGGMTQPSKVMAFLDFAGDWDPSLAFVMGGAIAIYAPAYRLITNARVPSYAREFLLPTKLDLDPSLVVGAGIFGIGWGLGGFCPGPGIVSAGAGQTPAIVFVVSMLGGMGLLEAYRWLRAGAGRQGAQAGRAGDGAGSDAGVSGGDAAAAGN